MDQLIVLGSARWQWESNSPIIRIGDLRNALKNNPPTLIIKPPAWWPTALFFLFALSVLLIIAIQGALSWRSLILGYNVESCQKLTANGVELSNCLKLTKP